MTSMRVRQDSLDGEIEDEVPVNVPPELVIGRSGLRRTGGYVDDEFLPQLRGRKAVQVFREMADNSPIAGAALFAIERLLRQVEWRVEPASSKARHRKDAEMVEQNMNDMEHSWGDLVGEACTMNPYGWALHELVYKRRLGLWQDDPRRRSKFTDGKYGWRRIPLRSQETMLRWVFDDEDNVIAMVQMAPPRYDIKVLPLSRCLLFRTTVTRGNPEGRSLLRNAYRPYFMLKRHEEHEAVGVERDLTGMPYAKLPPEYFNAAKGSKEAALFEAFKTMVTQVRRNEQEGVIFPQEFDEETKQPLFDFGLMTSGGSRQFNTDAIIQRYETRILMTMMADFIMTGHEDNGASYALHTDKSGLFRSAINSLANSIADPFNRTAIPQLFKVNGMRPDELPQLVPNVVDLDLGQLGGFLSQMASIGMQVFPDPVLENYIRDAARLPKLDKDIEKVREVEQRQAAVLSLAQQQLQAVQTQAQAEQGAAETQQAKLQQADPYGQQQAEVQGQQQLRQQADQMALERKMAPQPGGAQRPPAGRRTVRPAVGGNQPARPPRRAKPVGRARQPVAKCAFGVDLGSEALRQYEYAGRNR